MTNWHDLADKLNSLFDELTAAAPDAENELDSQLVELFAVSCRHMAHQITHLAEVGAVKSTVGRNE